MADDDDAADAKTKRRGRRSPVDGISTLPEHLQLEIFSRVGDVKALFRFAATCRGWVRRFTDPAFLRELSCPGPGSSHGESSGHHHRARLLGVFVQDKCFNRWDKATVQRRMTTVAGAPPPPQRAPSSALAPVFLPALGSPLGPAGRALTSFVGGNDDDGTFDYAEPLAARRGIVLLRLAPHTPEKMDFCHLLGVCNPVTGDRHVLPPLDWNLAGAGCRTWRLVGYAIITAADDTNGNGSPPPQAAAHFTFSQLLVITQDAVAYMHWYSAATRRWRAPTKCLDSRVFSLVDDGSSAVVHHGAAHWLCDDGLRGSAGDDHHVCMLSVEVATARVSLTRLPIRAGGKQVLFVNSDDKLAVASVYPVHVTVWTLPAGDDDDDDTSPEAAAPWPRTAFRIPVAVPYPHIDPQWQYHERWFNFNHGSLLALLRGSSVFVLDLETKVMEKVFILGFDNKAMSFLAAFGADRYLTCVPYEMDLVEFFTLQLGGMQERLGTN